MFYLDGRRDVSFFKNVLEENFGILRGILRSFRILTDHIEFKVKNDQFSIDRVRGYGERVEDLLYSKVCEAETLAHDIVSNVSVSEWDKANKTSGRGMVVSGDYEYAIRSLRRCFSDIYDEVTDICDVILLGRKRGSEDQELLAWALLRFNLKYKRALQRGVFSLMENYFEINNPLSTAENFKEVGGMLLMRNGNLFLPDLVEKYGLIHSDWNSEAADATTDETKSEGDLFGDSQFTKHFSTMIASIEASSGTIRECIRNVDNGLSWVAERFSLFKLGITHATLEVPAYSHIERIKRGEIVTMGANSLMNVRCATEVTSAWLRVLHDIRTWRTHVDRRRTGYMDTVTDRSLEQAIDHINEIQRRLDNQKRRVTDFFSSFIDVIAPGQENAVFDIADTIYTMVRSSRFMICSILKGWHYE
ncbi:MAG: hypothetical protein ACRCX2_34755 [Paraclostridium sp.]